MAKMAENHRHPAANRNMAISAPEATIAVRAAQKEPGMRPGGNGNHNNNNNHHQGVKPPAHNGNHNNQGS